MNRSLLRILGIVEKSDVHQIYGAIDQCLSMGRPIRVVRSPSAYLELPSSRWARAVGLLAAHLWIGLCLLPCYFSRRLTIVREFNNAGALIFALIVLPIRHKVLFNVNHNLSPRPGSVAELALRCLISLKFTFLAFDGSRMLPELQRLHPGLRVFTPPLPLVDRRRQPSPGELGGRIRIGVVGDFRPEKGGHQAVIEAAAMLDAAGAEVTIGAKHELQASRLLHGLRVSSTATDEDYDAFIRNCDALLILATEEAYRYRHSGIIYDAISRGVPVICPGFPVFMEQINHGANVGHDYKSLSDLPRIVEALGAGRPTLQSRFDAYLSARRPGGALELSPPR